MMIGKDTPEAEPSSRAYRRLVLAAFVVTFALVVLGGIVRATGSGLGCPDWPLCYGRIIPPFNLPTLLEYSHRLVSVLASILVVATSVVAWVRWRRDKAVLLVATIASVLLMLLVILGRAVVVGELPPPLVTAHLGSAQLLVGALAVLYVLLRRHDSKALAVMAGTTITLGLLWLTVAAVLGISAIMLSGAYVRGAGATFSCESWPFCGPEPLPSGGLPLLHMTHRLITLVTAGLLMATLAVAWHGRRGVPGGGTLTVTVAILFALQVAAGAIVIYAVQSPLARVAHLTLATGVWTGVVTLAALAWQSYLGGQIKEPKPRQNSQLQQDKRTAPLSSFLAYLALTKPAIVGLLLLTSLGGMFLAASGPPSLRIILAVLIGGALTAGGANALNHYLDRDIDRRMERTQARPIPSHRVSPAGALTFGAALNVVGFLVLMFGANALSAVLALAASGFYVCVYTGWLKRRTSQNIVIGGAAGAMPPVVGWAAVTGSLALPALYLFLIIFFWTPPHFWALALMLKADYARAGVPMLPVVKGERYTIKAMLIYTLVLVVISMMLFVFGAVGIVYLSSAVVLGVLFIWQVARLLRCSERRDILRVYGYSLLYVGLLFVAIILDSNNLI
ncbi:MAG: protoheme IX farnesyltransferase [Chloroflexi bacterium]|nr:protoheme IX farnesyltransferase [Chloroflexota bacterium]